MPFCGFLNGSMVDSKGAEGHRQYFGASGDITLFEPAVRKQTSPTHVSIRYRKQGDTMRSITIGSDARGFITSLWVTS